MNPPRATLLASVHPLVREAVVSGVRAQRPEVVVLRHELTTIEVDGSVHRTVDDGDRCEDTMLPVGSSCCLSCLLRDDTLEVLSGLGDRQVLVVLPPHVEPAMAAALLADAGVAEIDAIVVALDPARLEGDLRSDRPLSAIGGQDEPDHGDPRTIAEVLVRGLEHADVVVHAPSTLRVTALVDALAPHAYRVPPDGASALWLGAGRHDANRLDAALEVTISRPVRTTQHAGVSSLRWDRRRPLHPGRFLDALDDGTFDDVVRAVGVVWVATRPGTVLGLEVAGGCCELAAIDAWLAAVPDEQRIAKVRRDDARARWHRRFGDRHQSLVLTCVDRDVQELVAVLDRCLLTDDELAEGEPAWATWPDPFAAWLGDERDLLLGRVDGGPTDEEPPA